MSISHENTKTRKHENLQVLFRDFVAE